jgi:hypothetical protein
VPITAVETRGGAAGSTHPVSPNTAGPRAGGTLLFLYIVLHIINLKYLDMIMKSPPPLSRIQLEGASRTHGGILQGRAVGNQPNLADMGTTTDTLIPFPSKIHLYVSDSSNPADWAPQLLSRQVLKHPVTTSLKVVLQYISERHSPVQSESNHIYIYILRISLFLSEHNYRIYTFEEPNNCGRYEVALRDEEDLTWLLIENEYILRLLMVST